MNEKPYDGYQVALTADFETAVEAILKQHAALICWNEPGVSPVTRREDNGTCCFVSTGDFRFVVTCAHVWEGFQNYLIKNGNGCLWVSLTLHPGANGPSIPYRIANPILIDKNDGLDLATFTFEGIEKLESWRFYPYFRNSSQAISKGEGVFFLGYPGDEVRRATAIGVLGYTLFKFTVHDVSHRTFLLHDPPGARQWVDAGGNRLPMQRIPGVSGSPVLRVARSSHGLLKIDLAGFVSGLLSPGITNSDLEPVGMESSGSYEMSDGDIFITQARFLQLDGSIQERLETM